MTPPDLLPGAEASEHFKEGGAGLSEDDSLRIEEAVERRLINPGAFENAGSEILNDLISETRNDRNS